jgi:hypothetical protein
MGDGMVSLYMTSWEGVQDYECQEFRQAGCVSVGAEVISSSTHFLSRSALA